MVIVDRLSRSFIDVNAPLRRPERPMGTQLWNVPQLGMSVSVVNQQYVPLALMPPAISLLIPTSVLTTSMCHQFMFFLGVIFANSDYYNYYCYRVVSPSMVTLADVN